MGDQLRWPSLQSAVALSRRHRVPTWTGIRTQRWQRAEQSAEEMLRRLQPTAESEERRRSIIRYVQKLFSGVLGAEVLPFGSVPLKTYLPDGDIDLTAINSLDPDSSFATDVISILDSEEHNKDAEFEVKDVHYINAEVKLVKCLIENVVLDISFNQIGGLTTFCFLELVDRRIGKDHLFKRSIILIKAWCYYESRILGAHHGLISTYALETLIMHIFNIFHNSLNGPLGVLYRFLDYFSNFDWENYCISLHGPVPLSSLPNLVVESPESDDGDLLLNKEFLNSCLDMLSLSSWSPESNSLVFPKKHLNIIDPLKETNNLGRSVSKGNFYRIRSALAYGARKLGEVLTSPEEFMPNELNVFFMNTLDRHGNGERPDVQEVFLFSSVGSLSSPRELSTYKIGKARTVNLMSAPSTTGFPGASRSGGQVSKKQLGPKSSNQYRAADLLVRYPKTEINVVSKGNLAWDKHAIVEAQYHPTHRAAISRAVIKDHKGSLSVSETDCSLAREGDGTSKIPSSINLSDLTGDLELHFTSLRAYYGLHSMYGQFLVPIYQRSTEWFHDQQTVNMGHHQSVFPQMKANGPVPGMPSSPGNYSVNSSSVPTFHSTEDRLMTYGFVTYYPTMSYLPYRDQLLHEKEKNQVPVNQPPIADTCVAATSMDVNTPDKPIQEPSLNVKCSDANKIDQAKSTLLSSPQSPQLVTSGYSETNGFMRQKKGRLEFGSLPPVTLHADSQERHRSSNISTNPAKEPAPAPNYERPAQTYDLEDDGDFPPLSG